MKEETKTAWLFVVIVCALAAAVAFLCLGCTEPKALSENKGIVGWDDRPLQGAKVADHIGDDIGGIGSKKIQAAEAPAQESGAVNVQSHGDLVQPQGRKETTTIDVALVSLRDGDFWKLVAAFAMCTAIALGAVYIVLTVRAQDNPHFGRSL